MEHPGLAGTTRPCQRNRVRIPDVCLISRDQRREQVLTVPPLVCIEILSEGDALRWLKR